MKKIALLAALLLAGFWTLTAQQDFYGTVDYQFEMEGPNVDMVAFMMPEKMVVQYGKKGMKMYFVGGMMADMMGQIVLNGKTNEIFQLKADEQTAYMMGPEDLEGQNAGEPDEVVKELEVIKIQGYLCQKYKAITRDEEGNESVQYIWTTEALRAPEVGSPEMRAMTGMNIGAKGVPGFPLKSETYEPNSDMTITLTATNLDFTKPKNKDFKVPKGYAVEEFVVEDGE